MNAPQSTSALWPVLFGSRSLHPSALVAILHASLEAPSWSFLPWEDVYSPSACPGSAAPDSLHVQTLLSAPHPPSRLYPWPQSSAAARAPSAPQSADAAA